MNNGFYILPNEEGYLVKSHDTNSEIALFRSRRDAEVFISTLTLSPTPAFSNNYSSGTSIPQYSSQPQQIITPYSTNGTSPQVFFIQQPAPAQQVAPQPYTFYSMMPPISQMGGMCHGMYPNYYGQQNNPYGPWGCTCGHNNSVYNEHFERNPHIKNNEGLKPGWNNASNDLNIKKNNQLKDDTVPWTQKNDEYSNNGYEEQLVQSPVEEYNPQTIINQGPNNTVATDEILGQQYNDVPVTVSEPIITPNVYSEEVQQQENYSQPTNNQPYYEQAFVSNPVFLNQQSKQSEQYEQPKQVAKPINVANDDEFFNFANEQEFNNNSKISKKETKRLLKEELKAVKMQTKLEKQNRKKAKRKGALDIEELDPIVE
ncbi:hypothetical protein SKUN_00232 [Spiroplasma kunkelii CR2-3x]|uniref:Uncharacterized protein n=2 Tax=Spiroplasma kunkelii TaxID=47834 RepID=A0A0K2JEZ4_SPIKU|nr:hypothetical protein [Spiroplasma kunkelii]AAP58885.1 hypothetical protein [Spiroplasma kunkelii CR2-3x]ALA97154.1 hypothetical protein SKUN_00232 [Spiroplasma kunkelii CR2-3x]